VGRKRASVVSDPKRAVIDTNLLVRYLTEDNPSKANEVRRLLLKAAEREIRLLIPAIVIAELAWSCKAIINLNAKRSCRS